MLLRRNKFVYNQFLKVLRKSFPDRFKIAPFTKIPKLGRLIEYMAFEDDTIYYLIKDEAIEKKGKKKSISLNKKVTTTESSVALPSHVVNHFIEEANYLWVMNFCICRVSSNCHSHQQSLGCLFLGEAAMDIDPELGRIVTKEEAKQHIALCTSDGLVHLAGRNKLDTLWLDVGPGNKLMTICNCCDCCCLWKMIPKLSPAIADKVQAMPGIEVSISPDECLACGKCSDHCFVEAISYNEKNDHYQISTECRGCGRCITICPNEAINISITNENYINDTIIDLSKLIDVK